MNLSVISIAIVCFCLIALRGTWVRLRKDQIGIRSGVIWGVLWIFIGVFAIFPDGLDAFMKIAGMQNRMFFISMIAILILFALVFNLTTENEKLRGQVAKLAREVALKGNGSKTNGPDADSP